MNILHIIDDKKFIQACELTFNIAGINNFYVNKIDLSNSIIIENNIEAIFIHFLTNREILFLQNNKISVPIVWMFWGADGFSLPLFFNNFVGKNSQKAYKNWLFINKKYKRLISFLIKSNFKRVLNFGEKVKNKLSIINSFDFIVPIVPDDLHILKTTYPFIKGELYHFNYVTSIFLQDIDILPFSNGRNILVGNSATITNNHIEAFEKLSEIDIQAGTKVIVPLTYGNIEYKASIIDFIKNYRGLDIYPIHEFMEFEKYTEIISSCEILIMNHYRQQALGNIIMGLIMGCSIYLSNKSPIYHYLQQNDLTVFCLEDLEEQFILLSLDEKIQNRKRANDLFGQETQHKKVAKLLSELKVK